MHGREEKKEFLGNVDEAVLLLTSKVEYFLFHAYIKREQTKYFEKLKTEVSDEETVLQVDCAENFNMKEQDDIQMEDESIKYVYCFCVMRKRKFFLLLYRR